MFGLFELTATAVSESTDVSATAVSGAAVLAATMEPSARYTFTALSYEHWFVYVLTPADPLITAVSSYYTPHSLLSVTAGTEPLPRA